MPDWTDLKAEMAACWNTVWNVEPLPFSVPLTAALEEELPLLAAGLLDEELDEEHAARPIATTANPAVATCRLRRICISGYSLQS
jgi:hypothetical protein